jgi:hypothetical protein
MADLVSAAARPTVLPRSQRPADRDPLPTLTGQETARAALVTANERRQRSNTHIREKIPIPETFMREYDACFPGDTFARIVSAG